MAVGISFLRSEQAPELAPLLQRLPRKPYPYLKGLTTAERDAVRLRQVTEALHDPQGALLLAHEGGQGLGFLACLPLPWDSRVLGRRMGAISHLGVDPAAADPSGVLLDLLREAEVWARSRGFEFLLCKVGTLEMPAIHALERQGFLLVDTLLVYVCHTAAAPAPAAGRGIRPAEPGDTEELAELARTCFTAHFGRYHADPAIPPDRAARVYEEWIRSSCSGYADWIFVAQISGRLAGVSVWKGASAIERESGLRVGHYSIGAVHPDFGGRGLFTDLTRAGMSALAGEVDVIVGPTHVNNYPVQKAYHRLGWQVRDASHSFHRWL